MDEQKFEPLNSESEMINLHTLQEQMEAERRKLTLTKREVSEINHALFYAERLHHGTTGHNQLMLIATLAKHAGFSLDVYGEVEFPKNQLIALVESDR